MDEKVLKQIMDKEDNMNTALGELMGDKFAVVSGRMNPDLVKKVGEALKADPVFIDTKNWSNGAPRCLRPDNITFSGKTAIIITSLQYRNIGSPVEELELMFDACGSASEIHLIITWYCGKDDVAHSAGHVPTTAWIADKIKRLNPKSVNIFDPHQSGQLELFYPLRRRRFYFLRLLIEAAREIGVDQIAATDFGSTKRAKKVETFLKTGADIFVASKDHRHDKENELSEHTVTGKLAGKKVGLFDDMMLSGGTMKATALALKALKIPEVHAFAAHFDPTHDTHNNLSMMLEEGWLKSFTTTNSNQIDQKFLKLGGFKVLDVSADLAQLVERLVLDKSTTDLFNDI